ncbi:MAG: sigma-54-dependent Fis family transcriptional regulator [Polyangiaceae bacterium]
MLVLDEPPVALARRFVTGDLSSREAASHPVLARWLRAHQQGLAHDTPAFPEGDASSKLVERRERLEDVFREEHALLTPLAEQLAANALLAIVADPDGVILDVRGGGEFLDRASKIRLSVGARWAEETRGTNAIGTALSEGRPVGVVGAAHYERRNHSLFCYATPIRDGYGEVVALLDVSGPMTRHDRAVSVTVQAAGAALERSLRALAYAQTGAGNLNAIERLVHRCANPSLLVEANGEIRIASETARALLRVAPNTKLTCESVLGLPFTELASLACRGAQSLRFDMDHATCRVELDPIIGNGGRVLSVLVHLERRSPTSAGKISVARESEPPPKSRESANRSGCASPTPSRVPPSFDTIVSGDAAVDRAKHIAATFAATSLPVLLLAETGTGKELFARAIHGASRRTNGAFVALNCGALSSTLLESELFGYAPGSFTGAAKQGSVGKLGAADGGTLFLDEIAEAPEAIQAALLRVLDDGVYYRVGDDHPRKVDFRLICATCRDLPAMVESGRFRRDLFYRIHGACVQIPPLRHRSDRVFLSIEMLRRMGGTGELSADAITWIETHEWPGNVRELRSALQHASALAAGEIITHSHFPPTLIRTSAAAPTTQAAPQRTTYTEQPTPPSLPAVDELNPSAPRTRDAILREAMLEAVDAARGNLSEAARKLGVARSTLYRALGRKR